MGAPVRTFLRRWKVRRAIREIAKKRPAQCHVLKELQPVTPEDVLEWFSLHAPHYSEQERLDLVVRLFKDGDGPMSMAEVEEFCEHEVETFAAIRGVDERRNPSESTVYRTGNPDFKAQFATASF